MRGSQEQYQAQQGQAAKQITVSDTSQIPLQTHCVHEYRSPTFSGSDAGFKSGINDTLKLSNFPNLQSLDKQSSLREIRGQRRDFPPPARDTILMFSVDRYSLYKRDKNTDC